MLINAINKYVHKIMKTKTTTTPAQKTKRAIFSSIMVAVAGILALSGPISSYAASYQDQIRAIESEINAYQGQAAQLADQATSLENAINQITAEKGAIQAQITLSQTKYDQLVANIAANEVKLARQSDLLGSTLTQLYINTDKSPIEVLAGSDSLGDYIDQQEYRATIRDKVLTAMKKVKELKAELSKQRDETVQLIASQKVQESVLAAKEQEQTNLLTATRGQEAAYQDLVKSLESRKADAEAALARSLSRGSYKSAPAGPVGAGDIVGAVGNSGLSSGPHLHLEARPGGRGVTDPNPYIVVQPVQSGYISQPYGQRDPLYVSGYHPGIDYAAAEGTPILAIDSGNMYRGCSDSLLGTSGNPYGYVAIVEHSSGVISVYAHMSGGPAACSYNTYY